MTASSRLELEGVLGDRRNVLVEALLGIVGQFEADLSATRWAPAAAVAQ